MLLGILLVGSVACGGGSVAEPTTTPTPTSTPQTTAVKPSVGYIPQGWYLSDEDPWGTYERSSGMKLGLIGYTDTEDFDSVLIFYGDVPSSLKGWETDGDFLIARAIVEAIFEPEETGTMTLSGRLAGYAKAYDQVSDLYQMAIVFGNGTTYIHIYSVYHATSEDEAQVLSLIGSISF